MPRPIDGLPLNALKAARDFFHHLAGGKEADESIELDVIFCNAQTNTMAVTRCDTFAEAIETLQQSVEMAKAIDRTEYPSALPRLRDQVLLNIARWLTDGTYGPESERVFIQLAVTAERSRTTNDVKLIMAFTVADSLTAAALHDPKHWAEFDEYFAAFKELLLVDEEGHAAPVL